MDILGLQLPIDLLTYKKLVWFVIRLLIVFVLSKVLAYLFNRGSKRTLKMVPLAHNLVLLSLTTMMVITIIKSSLTLSLGLVGALSIIRFRTPIKDPEHLVFIFLAMTIGIGVGAEQVGVTTVGALICFVIIGIKSKLSSRKNFGTDGSVLRIKVPSSDLKEELNRIQEIVEAHASSELASVNHINNHVELVFKVLIDERMVSSLGSDLSNFKSSVQFHLYNSLE